MDLDPDPDHLEIIVDQEAEPADLDDAVADFLIALCAPPSEAHAAEA